MTQDILKKLLSVDSTFQSVIEKFPNLYAPCVIIRQKVSPEVVDGAASTIMKTYNSNKSLRKLLEVVNSDDGGISVAGKVIVISKKESDYDDIISMSIKEKWKYKGISIVSDYDQLRLYFY